MTCELMEPTLNEALSDPVIRAVMKADGVDPTALIADLRRVAQSIKQTAAGRNDRRI